MKWLRVLLWLLLALFAAAALWILWVLFVQPNWGKIDAYGRLGAMPEGIIISHEGRELALRDLNKNGRLDPYEDPRLPTQTRTEDLLSRMTLEEKAGQMFHPPITIGATLPFMLFQVAMGGGDAVEIQVVDKHITHFNFYGAAAPQRIAQRLNILQRTAARTRLGIPITISSDPLHEVPRGGGIAAFSNDGLSKWPSQLGFAAGRNPEMVRRFGGIAAREYTAIGIRTALHPMADLATDPRWGRNFGTFGADAELSAKLTLAYMKGFQGEQLGPHSVMTMVKHFPGGGAQQGGLDPHLPSGKLQTYPGGRFEEHIQPFVPAIQKGLRVIMPYYGVPSGVTKEEVAMAYNREILTEILREQLGFEGVICTDWGVISGRPWGVENLTIPQRYLKSVRAGVDQYGGESEPHYIVELVRAGEISEARVDESVRRILNNKFDLGLFEQPYADEKLVSQYVNTAEHRNLGREAQRQSLVLLQNKPRAVDGEGRDESGAPLLPLARNTKVYFDGIAPQAAAGYAQLAKTPEEADVIVLYLNTVFRGNQAPGSDELADRLLSAMLPDGNLNYDEETLQKAEAYAAQKPLVTVVDLNRPAVLKRLDSASTALLASFGVEDEIVVEALFGEFNPGGKLPFEIPESQAAAEAQLPDVPDDSKAPTFAFGHGLNYAQ